MELFNWDSIEMEQLGPLVARQVIHTENMTAAKIYLKKGAKVPEHKHYNEQLTILEKGRITFTVEGVPAELTPGSALRTPPHKLHYVEALEDSVALDLFSPKREDWISGDDAYLRG